MTCFLRVFFLFVTLFAATCLNASGIEEIVILVSPDGTSRVILASCNHDRLPAGQTEKLAQAIAQMQNKNSGIFEVITEKPASVFTHLSPRERITTDLEPALNHLGVPGVLAVDAEVRNVAILAFWLFDMQAPWLPPKLSMETGSRSCDTSKATLGDLCDEFQNLYNSLSEFSKQQVSYSLRRAIEDILEIAANQMNGFLRQIARFSNRDQTLLQCAINLASYDSFNPDDCERERIRDSIFQPFSQLFNVNLIRQIYQNTQNNKIILAGSLHTDAVKKVLVQAGWVETKPLCDPENLQDLNFAMPGPEPKRFYESVSTYVSQTRNWLSRSLFISL